MNKKAKAVAKAKLQWARDMRAREVVIAWLMNGVGRPPLDKKLCHTSNLRYVCKPS